MESSRKDDRLSAALEALRPLPEPAFAARLDERAAAGFPRHAASEETPLGWLSAHLRALTPRKVLVPAVATAFVAVVVATALVATHKTGSGSSALLGTTSSSEASGGESGGAESAEGEMLDGFSPTEGASAAGSAAKAEAAPSADESALEAAPNFQAAPTAVPNRAIERSAQVTLGAAPEDVADDAAQVFETVHAVNGVVLHSTVRDGSEGDAGARFELLIPSAKLDDALGSLSGIDEVLSRRDGTTDITAPTVSATEQLQDSKARIDSLLGELAASETEIERETLEAQLSSERRRAAVLRTQLTQLQRRASLSHVSVRIEGDAAASGSGGGWDLGDAAKDAGHILAIAAGVTLVGLAVLAPIALIALLFWLGRRAWIGYARRRALG